MTPVLWTALIIGPLGLVLVGVAALDIDFRDGAMFSLENQLRDAVGRAGLQVLGGLLGITCLVFAGALASGLVSFPEGWAPPPR